MSAALQPDIDFGPLDAAIDAAIGQGHAGGLPVLGFGEITLVLGWPPERPEFAVKRLPVFDGPARVEAYAALVAEYVGALRERGLGVIDTAVRSLAARRRRACRSRPAARRA